MENLGEEKMIEKKVWLGYYQLMLDGKKTIELRLADFKLSESQLINFREWDQYKKEYTGRSMIRRVKQLHRIFPTTFYEIENIELQGFFLMELESEEVKTD